MDSSTRHSTPKYVYDLPYFERMELCKILDQNDKWEELGGIYMNFDFLTIQTLRREILRGNSPADELLTKWGHQNHTILELFVLLSKMQHYQAMLTIKQFVDPMYHKLIYEGEQNLNRLFQSRCPKNCNNNNNNNNTNNNSNNDILCANNQAVVIGTPLSQQPTPPVILRQSYGCYREAPGGEQIRAVNPVSAQAAVKNKSENNGNHNVYVNTENTHVRSNERKILNNEDGGGLQQPGMSNLRVNAGPQGALLNKENGRTDMLKPKSLKGESSKDKNVSEISSIAESVGTLPFITFKELEDATNGWDQSAILGKGGFGTVYKGTWKNTQIAIKRTKNNDTDENRTAQIQQILGELKMLNSYRHDNILPLYGYSLGAEEPCLIYQFMPNGSLEDRLLCRQGTKPLSWFQRHNIATGTARGLQFLHTFGEKPLIHGDIKSANILLDSNYEPKIGDFGLAREGPYSHYTHMKVSRVHGTRPYLPDEFLRHKKFSTKVDTHSFGIVMYELGTGLRAYDDQRHHKFLKDLIENADETELSLLVDKKCGPDEHQTFSNLIVLGKRCASRRPKDRPEMVTVLQELNAMAVRRDTIVKVQNMIRQNSLSPLNPLEIQVFRGHLSQQKRISPVASVSNDRAVSPLQQHLQQQPEAVTRAVSSDNSDTPNNNPFFPLDPARNDAVKMNGKDLRAISPGTYPQGRPVSDVTTDRRGSSPSPSPTGSGSHKLLNNVPHPPVISVSPPSEQRNDNSESPTSSTSDEMTSEVRETSKAQHDANENIEDFDYDYSSQYENVLPLISALGIKTKPDEKREEVAAGSTSAAPGPDLHEPLVPEVQTTARGKDLWVLGDST